jgi:hypothetical protein
VLTMCMCLAAVEGQPEYQVTLYRLADLQALPQHLLLAATSNRASFTLPPLLQRLCYSKVCWSQCLVVIG